MSKNDWLKAKKSIEKEYSLLIENSTCEVVSPPTEANIITGQWVFKLKKN